MARGSRHKSAKTLTTFQYIAIGTFGFAMFLLGWWRGQRAMRGRLAVINEKVEAGKVKVQKAVNKHK